MTFDELIERFDSESEGMSEFADEILDLMAGKKPYQGLLALAIVQSIIIEALVKRGDADFDTLKSAFAGVLGEILEIRKETPAAGTPKYKLN